MGHGRHQAQRVCVSVGMMMRGVTPLEHGLSGRRQGAMKATARTHALLHWGQLLEGQLMTSPAVAWTPAPMMAHHSLMIHPRHRLHGHLIHLMHLIHHLMHLMRHALHAAPPCAPEASTGT